MQTRLAHHHFRGIARRSPVQAVLESSAKHLILPMISPIQDPARRSHRAATFLGSSRIIPPVPRSTPNPRNIHWLQICQDGAVVSICLESPCLQPVSSTHWTITGQDHFSSPFPSIDGPYFSRSFQRLTTGLPLLPDRLCYQAVDKTISAHCSNDLSLSYLDRLCTSPLTDTSIWRSNSLYRR